jgi:glycosyltransferase involved in cell wall biosynthesis
VRILQISDGYGEIPGRGPLENVVFEISKQMARMGHSVTILERDHAKKVPKREWVDGVNIIRLDRRRACGLDLFNLGNLSSVIRIVLDGASFAVKLSCYLNKKENNYDIIHVHLPFSSLVMIFLKRKLRKRIVFTSHSDRYRLNLSSRIRLPIFLRFFSPDLFLMKRVARSMFLNQSLRDELVSASKIEIEKTCVIPNGVDAECFRPDIDASYVRKKYLLSDKVILFVGFLGKRKGVDYLVKAANIVVNKYNDKEALFLLVGRAVSEEYFGYLCSLIRNYGLEKNIKFTGRIAFDDLKALYVSSAVFVLPSLEEGFGLVVTEAMASGRPVIGTKTGGIPMQIQNGVNGFVVEPANEEQLAEKIEYLLHNRGERERMGANSRKIALEKFDWRLIAEKYSEVYRSILNSN